MVLCHLSMEDNTLYMSTPAPFTGLSECRNFRWLSAKKWIHSLNFILNVTFKILNCSWSINIHLTLKKNPKKIVERCDLASQFTSEFLEIIRSLNLISNKLIVWRLLCDVLPSDWNLSSFTFNLFNFGHQKLVGMPR